MLNGQTFSSRTGKTSGLPKFELKEVLAHRENFYEKASEVQVDTSFLDVDGVVNNVLSIFQEREVEFDGREFVRDAF